MTSRSWVALPFTATSARSHASITPTSSVLFVLTAATGWVTGDPADILTDGEFATTNVDLLDRM